MEVDERTRSATLDVVERELARVRGAHTAERWCTEDKHPSRVRFRVAAKAGG